MTTYFTSDLHLGHEDMFVFAQRPWGSVAEHDAAIIENINATVGRGDELYVLGDFTLLTDERDVRAYLDAIRCRNPLRFKPAYMETLPGLGCPGSVFILGSSTQPSARSARGRKPPAMRVVMIVCVQKLSQAR